MRKILKYSLMLFVAIALAHDAVALDTDFARFAGTKLAEARKAAGNQTNKVPSFVWSFFDAIRVDDWDTATNLMQRIESASGRYSNSNRETLSPGLQSAIWPSISESIGAYEQFHEWDNKWLHRFGTNLIASVPGGSIYFGGTDPGRFIISALVESEREARPFFILTQNQLVDTGYLDYLRANYGSRIYIPTTNDLQHAFQDYLADAQQRMKEGKLMPGEDVHTDKNGHVQASGKISVIQINGRLAKIILEKNPSRECYIEESFQLDWMYPQLSPHGLIMQLHHAPLDVLATEDVEKDMDYWEKLTGAALGDWLKETTSLRDVCDFCDKIRLRKDLENFKGDAAFVNNEDAQKTFSKLRSSIGGLYAWRATHAKNDTDRNDMRKNAEFAFRQAFALCPYSPEAVFRYTSFLVELNRRDDAILIAQTCQRLGHDPETATYMRELLRSLHGGG